MRGRPHSKHIWKVAKGTNKGTRLLTWNVIIQGDPSIVQWLQNRKKKSFWSVFSTMGMVDWIESVCFVHVALLWTGALCLFLLDWLCRSKGKRTWLGSLICVASNIDTWRRTGFFPHKIFASFLFLCSSMHLFFFEQEKEGKTNGILSMVFVCWYLPFRSTCFFFFHAAYSYGEVTTHEVGNWRDLSISNCYSFTSTLAPGKDKRLNGELPFCVPFAQTTMLVLLSKGKDAPDWQRVDPPIQRR